jgi:hypothetical protein
MDAEGRAEAAGEIAELLGLLAMLKGKGIERPILDLYAETLVEYPPDLVRAAIRRHAESPDPFIPPVGALLATMVDLLPPGLALDGEAAWKLARRVVSRHQPQTRPDPGGSGNPAVDAALAALGGPAALAWEGAEKEGYARRAFLAEYARHARTAEHLRWALAGGMAALPPPVVRGIEGGESERAAVLDGADPVPPYPQLTARARDLTEDERTAARREIARNIALIAERLSMPGARRLADEPLRPTKIVQHGGRPVVAYADEGEKGE